MGQKIPPPALRLGITQTWKSRWYAPKKDYGEWLVEDQQIRKYIKKEYRAAGIPKIDIERVGDKVQVIIHAARPGLLIGKRGAKVDQLGQEIATMIEKRVDVQIREIEQPELNAQLVSEAIAEQLEKRAAYKRTMHRYLDMVLEMGALGAKIMCKGRLGGAEIARSDFLTRGKLPLHTFRADIDYGTATAILSKGTIGVKVWIYKGEVKPPTATPSPVVTGESSHGTDAQAS